MLVGVDATSLLCAQPRGEGRSLFRLYAEMARLRPDFSFLLFGQGASAVSDLWQGIPRATVSFFDLPGYRWNTWENLGLPWHAWRAGCDVLHCASSGAPMFSAVPVVMTVHDLIPLRGDDGQSLGEKAFFRRRLANGMRVASAVVTVSANTRSDLEAAFPGGGAPVEVIHWGCDIVPPGSVRPLDAEYVLALGGGAPRKNVSGTLRAFATIAERYPDLKLVVLGMGRADLSHELTAQAETMGLAGRLVVPGFVSDSELPAWFEHAACLCYLSLYEGFGLPLLEAMSFGVPVVASSTSSIPEVVGDAGLLVDPLDAEAAGAAIDRVLRDREFRRQLGDAARMRAVDFPWHVAADRMAKILIAAAKSRRSLA